MPKARARTPRPRSDGREPAMVAELRAAIVEANANCYQLARKAGVDEAGVRRFVSRERSLSLDSAGRIAEALGLRVVRPARPRKFAGSPMIPGGEGDGGES